jgi:RHS repeat-associated protein
MGYYLTTSPEASPRVISCASPKTHVPGSPVKERGYRYLMPETGKWLSRDPIAERGGRNLYAFCKNSPSIRSDPLGLSFEVERQTGWSRREGREGWTIPDGPAWISMTVSVDSNCSFPSCYRLIYRNGYMHVVLWLWILADDWVEPHEELHVKDVRAIAYDQAVTYAKNYAGRCYTENVAFCWWKAIAAASEKFFWEATYKTLLRDNMNDPSTAADYARAFNNYRNADANLVVIENSCRGMQK